MSHTCGSCNGSGLYDIDGSPPCGACNGTGEIDDCEDDQADGPEIARLRRERIEQEAMNLELAGDLEIAQKKLDGARTDSNRFREERDDLLARLYRAGEERCELRVELDEARAEVASWVEWSDHHSVWKALAAERPPPEEIRSELGSYLDDREQHLATLADLGQQLEAGRDLAKARDELTSAARLIRIASTRARLALRGAR